MESRYEALKLEKQLCFPLYACSRSVIREYKPYLDRLDLTYTQYIAMLVLWEQEKLTVKELGQKLYLDSGTLTPLLKKLEAKGYLKRERSKEDERNLYITLTEKGLDLKDRALPIPYEMAKCLDMSTEEKETLYHLLYKVLDCISGQDK